MWLSELSKSECVKDYPLCIFRSRNGCSRSGAIQVAEERSAEKSAPGKKIPQAVESDLHGEFIELWTLWEKGR